MSWNQLVEYLRILNLNWVREQQEAEGSVIVVRLRGGLERRDGITDGVGTLGASALAPASFHQFIDCWRAGLSLLWGMFFAEVLEDFEAHFSENGKINCE